MRGRIVAQALLTIAVAGCGGGGTYEYRSPEGQFRVEFPRKPTLREEPVQMPRGRTVEKIASLVDRSRTERYVSYIDLPAGPPRNQNARLDGACRKMATQSQLVIRSKMPIAINGHPGREISFEGQPGNPAGTITGRGRIYLVGARLYEVYILGPTGSVTPETIDGFLNSFTLLDQAPQQTAVATGPPPDGVSSPAPAGKADRSPMGFYAIPVPATVAIVSDTSSFHTGSEDRPAETVPHAPAALSAGVTSARGARIRGFEWIDENTDVVAGSGGAGKADGTQDQHFRLSVNLPPNAIVEELVVTSGASHRWVTKPSDRDGPIGIFQNGRPVARTYVAQVGFYSGSQNFDLYVNTASGDGPGTVFDLQVVLSVAGDRTNLNSQCKRPGQPTTALAVARPSAPRPTKPVPPPAPSTPPPTVTEPSAPTVTEPPPPTAPVRSRAHGRESTEVPTFLRPAAGGASIVSFDWIDRKDDRVGTSGRVLAPDGGPDEHYRLVLDLPPAATVEDIIITGGGELRWSTRPSTQFGPVAVFANQQAVNRGQSVRLGTFSGRWTFELYVESDAGIRPGHVFGAEVVLFIRGTRHHLTARCERK